MVLGWAPSVSGEDLLGRQTVGRNIRESAAGEVSVWCVVFLGRRTDVRGQVGVHGSCLVGWLSEVVAEAARAVNPCYLWAYGLGASDGSNIRTCAGELRSELRRFLAIVGLARCTDSYSGRSLSDDDCS